MSHHQATTLPRDFRYPAQPRTPEPQPRTPEPDQQPGYQEPPPAPLQARMRLRKRGPSIDATTNVFMASMQDADIPLPTIEGPEMMAGQVEDHHMADAMPVFDAAYLSPTKQETLLPRTPPPKTPMAALPRLQTMQRVDWDMGAFPRERSSSIMSDSSDDSTYLSSSRPSEDSNGNSPNSEYEDPFVLPTTRLCVGKGKGPVTDREITRLHRAKITTKQGPHYVKTYSWSNAMDDHLMAVLTAYIQDPTVTPIRTGPNCTPPDGVCHRVARQAKRTWKGSENRSPRRVPRINSIDEQLSGRVYRQAPLYAVDEYGPSRAYAAWPHSMAATRQRIRYLSKKNNGNMSRLRHMSSRSPSPFSNSAAPASDMNTALSVSTSTTMQAAAPVTNLAANDVPISPTVNVLNQLNFHDRVEDADATIRSSVVNPRPSILGSSVFSNTYGPSSTKDVQRPSAMSSKSQGGSLKFGRVQQQLASPFKPQQMTGTMKRRAMMALDEAADTGVTRPIILNEALYGTPFKASARRVRSRGFSLGDQALGHQQAGITQAAASRTQLTTQLENEASPALLPTVKFDAPPRLGSPFRVEGAPVSTFPRRVLSGDKSATVRRSGYASMHQSRRSIESFDFGDGPSLHSRLSHFNQKLAEIRDRPINRRFDRGQ